MATRRVRGDARWVPPVCRMDEGACLALVDTREARVLGPPNSALGAAWYATLLLATPFLDAPVVLALVRAGATAALLFSAWLAWVLLARLRVRCVLCWTGHAVNAAVAALAWTAGAADAPGP